MGYEVECCCANIIGLLVSLWILDYSSTQVTTVHHRITYSLSTHEFATTENRFEGEKRLDSTVRPTYMLHCCSHD